MYLLRKNSKQLSKSNLNNMANSVMVLAPYWYNGTWVFDDDEIGVRKEAFVSGSDTIISEMVKEAKLKNPKKGIKLLFSATPFPDHQVHLVHDGGDENGNYYLADKYKLRGWLCPVLFKYFPAAPKEMYAKVEKLVK